MVSASGAVAAVTPVPVARIVIVLVPAVPAPVVVSCNVGGAPVPVLGFGVNVAVTPAGRFSAAKVTLPVKFVRARAMVVVALAFCPIDNVAGVSVSPMVPPPNQPPVVSAGPDRALREPETSLVLQGAVADDGRPSGTTTQAWSVVSGPGPVRFADATAIATSVSFEAPGSYRLRLTASDGALVTADDVSVFYAAATVLPDLLVKTVDTG